MSPPQARTDTADAGTRQAGGAGSTPLAPEACRLVTVHMAAATHYRIRLTPAALEAEAWAEARKVLDERLRSEANLVLRNSRGRGLIVPTSLVEGVDVEPCGSDRDAAGRSGS